MEPGTVAEFEEALEQVLPAELPRRAEVVARGARHLELVTVANRTMNLTRITSARDAAVKHVLDSLLPWRQLDGALSLLDLGSGAGYPGIPLAILRPELRVLLAESTGKKAVFLEKAVAELGLDNVVVHAERGEAVLRTQVVDVVVARAVGAIPKILDVLLPVHRRLRRLLLYRGPAGEQELQEAEPAAARLGLLGEVVLHAELPDGLGSRTLVEYRPVRSSGRRR